MNIRTFTPIALAVVALSACDTAGPTELTELTYAPAEAISAVPGVTEVVGETGPGSTYALFKPEAWNGSLVVYAHGYVQPFLDPQLPNEPLLAPVRDELLSQGYAVAYSSWSETGYAVKDAAIRTHQLNGLFDETFGAPDRTYLWGLSLGGLTAEMLSERYSSQYDGTLAVCGVMAGGLWNAEYVAHFRVLFDFFYPGVLPGSLYEMPEGYLVIPPDPARGYPGSQGFQDIFRALSTNPLPAFQMAAMDQIQLAWATPQELISGFIQVLGYQVNGANALSDRLNGHSFFDNTGVVYSGSRVDAAVNAGVARFTGDPSAVNYFDHWWQPTGQLHNPFVTLHTTRDPIVPFRTEDMFARTVGAAGASPLLLQRSVQAFGHCQFSPADVLDAFESLVDWVETGVKPAA